jgi:hypothetical protein
MRRDQARVAFPDYLTELDNTISASAFTILCQARFRLIRRHEDEIVLFLHTTENESCKSQVTESLSKVVYKPRKRF